MFGGHLGFHVAGHEIHQEDRVFNALDSKSRLLRQVARATDDLYGQFLDRLHQRSEFACLGHLFCHGERHHGGFQVRFHLCGFHHLEASLALYDDGGVAVGHLQGLYDLCSSTHLIQVVDGRVLHVRVDLCDDADGLAFAIVFLDQADGLVASHGDGDDDARVKHRVAQRQYRQFLRHLFVLSEAFVFDGQHGDELGVRVHHI